MHLQNNSSVHRHQFVVNFGIKTSAKYPTVVSHFQMRHCPQKAKYIYMLVVVQYVPAVNDGKQDENAACYALLRAGTADPCPCCWDTN